MQLKIKEYLKLINNNINNIFLFLILSFIVFFVVFFLLYLIFKTTFFNFFFIFFLSIYFILFSILFIIKYVRLPKSKLNSKCKIFTDCTNKKNVFSNFNEYEEVSYIYISSEKREIRAILKKYKKDFLLFDIDEDFYKEINSINDLCVKLKYNFRRKIKLFHPDSVGHDYYIDTVRQLQESFIFLSKTVCKNLKSVNKNK